MTHAHTSRNILLPKDRWHLPLFLLGKVSGSWYTPNHAQVPGIVPVYSSDKAIERTKAKHLSPKCLLGQRHGRGVLTSLSL